MVALIEQFLGRLRLAALGLVGIVALSAWNCDDLRYRPVAQETPAVESDAGEAAKPADSKVPDLGAEFKRLIFEKFGLAGLIVLALAVFGFGIWWKWPEIRKRPFVERVIDRFSRAPLPKADPARFTVALAHLENDPKQADEKLIFEGLNEGFAGEDVNAVQILRFDRTIEIGDPQDLEPVVAGGHETARSYLAESGADVLIWGTVVRGREESAPKLYWTTAGEGDRPREPGRYATQDLALPMVFWRDLVDVLRLLVVTRDAEFHSLKGHFVADRVGPFVEKVHSLLTGGGQGWTGDASARVKLVLADSLSTLGEQSGENPPLEEAVVRYKEVLTHYTRQKVPLDWATTQKNLGNAFLRLGERESGTARLEEAVEAYREALQEWTREKVPLSWATTQNNLGFALSRLGERESGTERLEEAVEAYRAALQERTREKVPLSWATTQNNLGFALSRLGERESGTERLEEAVEAYRAALEERTREKVPLDWAGTQNNLGIALGSLGERESGTARLEEGVEAYRAALQELTRERVPLDWAITQNNLGNALTSLGERESGTARLKEAVEAYREALEERTREKVPLDWAMTQNNLGTALRSLGELESGTERLEQAVAAYRAALEERTREKVPLDWAMTQNNLGNALQSLGERESGTERLEQAVAAYRAALEERTREKVPLDLAMTQNNLGNVLRSLGERSRDAELVCDALGAHLAGWEVFTQGKAGHYAAIAKRGVEADLAVLKDLAEPAEYEQCLNRHRPTLDRALGRDA